jgi:hypothetical protein
MEDLIKVITMIAIGVTATEVYPEVSKKVSPILRNAIQHQEDTVQVAEYLELGCSVPAREQWDVRKQEALARLESFETLANTQVNDTDSEPVNQ